MREFSQRVANGSAGFQAASAVFSSDGAAVLSRSISMKNKKIDIFLNYRYYLVRCIGGMPCGPRAGQSLTGKKWQKPTAKP